MIETTGEDGHDGRSYGGPSALGDFTVEKRVLLLCAIAIVIGAIAAFVAVALLKLIGFFTNLFFFQRLSTRFTSPAANTLGALVIFVPVVGALIVGLMARYGSERIRGHGIPEAIEAILMNGSKVQPRVALLKPLSAAISIGSGGPFGAEGPIIVTGGAFGSVIAQLLHLTSAERKALLVAGAAAGMSATFQAPVASVLLAVELLLFEWKPRSYIPVALASATAAAVSRFILSAGPLFPVPMHGFSSAPASLLACVLVGLAAGLLSILLTTAVYATEDFFRRLPIHWMWWPAIGGLAVGVGGWFFPQALGVGYDTIGTLLRGDAALHVVFGILVVKSAIWSIALGSGTSGGVLAPLLMMGAALGSLEGHWLPAEGPGFWALVSMGAMLGGTMRSPLMGIIFSFELTHDMGVLLPLLISATVAYTVTTLTMKRSILTEKVARRGFHLSCEYSIDPLEILSVAETMAVDVVTLPAELDRPEVLKRLRDMRRHRVQALYPVVDGQHRLIGVVTRSALVNPLDGIADGGTSRLSELMIGDPVVAYPDEPLRVVVHRMAEFGVTRLPVVADVASRRLVGLISLRSVLQARARNLEAERRRERIIELRRPQPTLHPNEPAAQRVGDD